MTENKSKTDALANGCPTEGESVIEQSTAAVVVVGVKAGDLNSVKVEESPVTAPDIELAGKKSGENTTKDISSGIDPKKIDIANKEVEVEVAIAAAAAVTAISETTTTKSTATTSDSEKEVENVIEETPVKIEEKDLKDEKDNVIDNVVEIIDESVSDEKEIDENLSKDVENTGEDVPKNNLSLDITSEDVEILKKNTEEEEAKLDEDEPEVIEEIITEEKEKEKEKVLEDCESVRPRRNLTPDISELSNHCKIDEIDEQVEEEDDEDEDEEEMETEEPEEVEEEEEDEEDEDDDDDDENDNEQLELGIVGPPTAVSELINEEELRCAESVLLTEDRSGVENVQDHVAEWVQNSANNKVEELTIDEDDNENENEGVEGSEPVPSTDLKIKKNNDNIEKNVEVLATRKSKRVVNNIIKRSIKCLNKMHAMDTSGGMKGAEKVPGGPKKVEKVLERDEKTSGIKISKECREVESAAPPPRNHRDRRNHHNHSNHRRNGGGQPPEDRETYGVKKEPTSEPETDPEPERDAVPELRKRTGSERAKNVKIETESKKRRSTDDIQNSNGKSKRACLEQREEFISSLVGGEKVTTEELTVRADQLRAELQALDQLARAKEKEWNEILSMRKLKEEAYLRIERRRQVVGFMEGNGQLNEASVIPSVSLSLEPEWDNAKEKSNSTEATLSDKSITRPQVTLKQNENGQKESSDVQNSETRQIGEGRQGPMVDVRTIIADYRLRHPETVPRRSRRMRNSVNVGLGAGGAMVDTTHVGADSRPSSTDSCKSSSNATDPSNSMSFKDVLVQFAKLSQQQGEAVKTPQNYPDVTLHPVLPSPAAPQTAAIQQSGSLLHGILTKSQSPRPTTFSPTLARLLTAPERDRCNPIATSTPQQSTTTQHLLQAYQGTNPVSISDLLSSSKARTEITITPVVSTPTPQSHSNSLIHVEDVEEETTVIEERGRSSNARDDSPPRCQGCQDRAAQFVCAGCGNQWYCSRECQVSAWDEHSEVCSG